MWRSPPERTMAPLSPSEEWSYGFRDICSGSTGRSRSSFGVEVVWSDARCGVDRQGAPGDGHGVGTTEEAAGRACRVAGEIGMALFRDRSIAAVVKHLGLVFSRTSGGSSVERRSVVAGAIPAARVRVGGEPLLRIFFHSAEVWATASSEAESWHGLTILWSTRTSRPGLYSYSEVQLWSTTVIGDVGSHCAIAVDHHLVRGVHSLERRARDQSMPSSNDCSSAGDNTTGPGPRAPGRRNRPRSSRSE